MLHCLHRLLPLVSTLSLLVALALLASLWHEARQTRQLLLTLVAQDSHHTHLALQAHLHAVTTIQQLQEQTALLRGERPVVPVRGE